MTTVRKLESAAFPELEAHLQTNLAHLKSQAYRMLNNWQDAEDAVQDAAVAAFAARATFDRARPVGPWFYRILRHECGNRIARRVKSPRMSSLAQQGVLRDDDLVAQGYSSVGRGHHGAPECDAGVTTLGEAAHAGDAIATVLRNESDQYVQRILKTVLSSDDAMIFYQVEIEERDRDEVSSRYGVSREALRQALTRARKRLREVVRRAQELHTGDPETIETVKGFLYMPHLETAARQVREEMLATRPGFTGRGGDPPISGTSNNSDDEEPIYSLDDIFAFIAAGGV